MGMRNSIVEQLNRNAQSPAALLIFVEPDLIRTELVANCFGNKIRRIYRSSLSSRMKL